jgi:hypothetical protein
MIGPEPSYQPGPAAPKPRCWLHVRPSCPSRRAIRALGPSDRTGHAPGAYPNGGGKTTARDETQKNDSAAGRLMLLSEAKQGRSAACGQRLWGTRGTTRAGLIPADGWVPPFRQLRAYASAARTSALVPARRKLGPRLGRCLTRSRTRPSVRCSPSRTSTAWRTAGSPGQALAGISKPRVGDASPG